MNPKRSLSTRVAGYLATDIWRVSLAETDAVRSFLIRQLRVILLTLRGFDKDRCSLRASALTFYSLLSIVPVVAMAFGIAKGFGVEDLLRRELMARFSGQEEVLSRVIDFAHNMLQTTRGGMVAGAGLLVLFWAVIKVLMNIESSFNEIWEIKKQRSYGQRFSNYLSIMLISPVIIIVSGSATVFITTQVTRITESIELLGFLSPVIFLSLKVLPYGLMWALLTFLYVTVPNTRVSVRSGFLAAVVAGTTYQVVQWGYIAFQVGIARHNAIYGSFAALPMFLIWLQLSWLIILFGAEFSFASQNVDTYEFEPDCRRASQSTRTLLSLEITRLIVKGFERGEPALTGAAISRRLNVPVRLTRQLLSDLVEGGLLLDIRTGIHSDAAYQPARGTGVYTIAYVMDTLERSGAGIIPAARTRELYEIGESLGVLKDTVRDSPANRLLKDI